MVLAVLYAGFLASLPNELFRDRLNYIIYAEDFELIANSYSGFSLLFNEPLFLFYNYILSFFFSSENVPKVGVFFIAATFSFFILRFSKNWVVAIIAMLMLFFVSYTFHAQLVVLRQGIATALLMWTIFYFKDSKWLYFIVFLLGFFHTSFFIVFLVFYFDYVLRFFLKDLMLRLIVFSMVMFLASFFMLDIATILGVRQASETHLLNNENNGGGFLLFLFMMGFIYLRGLNNVYNDRFGKVVVLGFIIYLVFYFTIPISGRIISVFLPFFYVYFASNINFKIFFSGAIFLLVNLFIFKSSIEGGSLTYIGVLKLNSFLWI